LKKTILLLICLVALFSTSSLSAQCTTNVSGAISGQTWTQANSPYCVGGDIVVNSLVIEPGVNVQFLGDYEFKVSGVLTAVGTDSNLITFTTEANNLDGWQGIFFDVSLPGSVLAYFTVENSINSGIRINNSNPTIRNGSILNNSTSQSGGGGIRVTGTSTFILNDCIVAGNSVTGYDKRGGGILVDSGVATIKNCMIDNNSVIGTRSTYLAYSKGGGLYVNGDLELVKSEVLNNTASASVSANYTWVQADSTGGGVFVTGGILTMTQSRVSGNSAITNAIATGPGGGLAYSRGGGVFADIEMSIVNSIIDNNTVPATSDGSITQEGGGVLLNPGIASVINSTIADNSNYGFWNEGTLTVANSIFWGNNSGSISGSAIVSYSDVQGEWPGTGNINLNPLFVNPPIDYRIDVSSPAVDAGDPISSPPDFPSHDIDGDARPQDGDGDNSSIYDMGADEILGLFGPDLIGHVQTFYSGDFGKTIYAELQVENIGNDSAGSASVVFLLYDGITLVPLAIQAVPGLAVGETTTLNFGHNSLKSLSGKYIISFIYDLALEQNKTNNMNVFYIP